MPRILHPLLALLLFTASSQSIAQQYNSFRLVGDVAPVAGGTVTSIELFPESSTNAKLSFYNVAGLSTVYDIRFSPSQAIRDDMAVYMPPAGFGPSSAPELNLDDVKFLTGKLIDPDNASTPPHWFRMTLHEGIWSGTFRVANQVYSINRSNVDPVIDVRGASGNTTFQPSRQVKVSAVIDDDYIFTYPATEQDSNGHIHALESIHVMDGLIADSLGITIKLEQLIYRPATELAPDLSQWLQTNGEAFGLTDNMATFVFRGAPAVNAQASEKLIVQTKPDSYQFDSAYHFGQLLGLPQQSDTLNASDQITSVRSAYWNNVQSEYLDANPPAAELTQILSYDEPEIEVSTPQQNEPIPQHILDSESEESSQGLGPQDDGNVGVTDQQNSIPTGASSGGGSSSVVALLMLLVICVVRVFRRTSAAYNQLGFLKT